MKKQQRLERVEIVNAIIRAIASRGRRFFYDSEYGTVSQFTYIGLKKNRLWFCDKRGGKVNPYPSNRHRDYHFSDGGTLWALVHDFSEYILTGKMTNGKNGYGGLYCPHWGYSAEDMEAIRERAVELGYLQPRNI